MVGRMVKLKCRVDLRNLVIKKPAPRLRPLEPEPEPEVVNNVEEEPVSIAEDIPPRPKVRRGGLDVTDTAYFHCPQSDVVETPEVNKEDIIGSIYELEEAEISTPKGAQKDKLKRSPDFPNIPEWIKPEVLLDEMKRKSHTLKDENDNDDHFVLPGADSIFTADIWEVPELMELKGKLNAVKSILDHFPLEEWHYHTKQMNIAQLVMQYVKRYFNAEFSSQAWGKMFEMLCSYDVVPAEVVTEVEAIMNENKEATVPFDSLHLCEAPGAFVSALNHFLKISYPPIEWNWLATTLSPYHEGNDVGKMINDDRLILKTMDHWTFLEDKTGNILSKTNLDYLVKEQDTKLNKPREEKTGVKESSLLLITADGSIDCQSNPSEQEATVAPLHFGEIVTALKLLKTGGSFVLKIFTFLEAPTICHLYLLSCVFKKVELFKPATSKEGNSEVYVICIGFLGKYTVCEILDTKLVDSIETYGDILSQGKVLFPQCAIPQVFMDRVIAGAEFFCNYQMKIIKRNASCFPCDNRVYQVMKPFRKEAAEEWIEWSEIQPIPVMQRLCSDAEDKDIKATHVDIRLERGCFADKVLRQEGGHRQKVEYIRQDLAAYPNYEYAQNHALFGGLHKIGSVDFEKPYMNIRCSRFCYGRLLSNRDELRGILKEYEKELVNVGLNNLENVCMGHSIKRVYESMAKSCDVVLNNLEVLCFMKMTWDFVMKTDFEDQRADIKNVLDSVKDLEKDRSLFLCRFPLLTRLQTGLIYCLASVFEKVIIFMDAPKNVIGIMLHKYKGIIQPEQKKMFQAIDDIMDILFDDDFGRPVLQLAPMKSLIDFMPPDFLVKYNITLNTQDLLRTINVVQSILK